MVDENPFENIDYTRSCLNCTRAAGCGVVQAMTAIHIKLAPAMTVKAFATSAGFESMTKREQTQEICAIASLMTIANMCEDYTQMPPKG